MFILLLQFSIQNFMFWYRILFFLCLNAHSKLYIYAHIYELIYENTYLHIYNKIYKNPHVCAVNTAFVKYVYFILYIIFVCIWICWYKILIYFQLYHPDIHDNCNKYFYSSIHEHIGEAILPDRCKNWQW